MKDRKWLGSISYDSGIFHYSSKREPNEELGLSRQEFLHKASEIFDNADKVTE